MKRVSWKVLATTIACAACTQAGPTIMQVKVLALTPDQYFGQSVHVRGKISEPGPGFSHFALTDETGTVLITTETLGSPFPCERDSLAELQGKVRGGNGAGQTYLSLEKVVDCQKNRGVTANP